MKRLFRLSCLVLALLFVCGTSVSALSPALEVIRAESCLVKCCAGGARVSFSAEEFLTLTGTDFEYLTVTKTPPLSDGVLKLAGVDVFPGQRVSLSGLSYLSFVPGRSFEGETCFSFSVAAVGWEGKESKCVIRYAERENMPPVAVSTTVETYKNLTVSAALGVYDPDGDKTTQLIRRYPHGGTLHVEDGVLTYTPREGFLGADSFVYTAVDSFGNKSDSATVDIKVTESKSGIYFADMRDSTAHLAAIRAAEEELVTYTLIGNSYYFEPAEEVSRIDFAVMLVTAAGAALPHKPYPTDIFTDTGKESREKRMYLETAVTSGFIKVDSPTFRPKDAITLREAVEMTEKALTEGAASISSAFYERDGNLTKEDAVILLSAVKGQ